MGRVPKGAGNAPSPAATKKQLDTLGAIGERFNQWRPAADVLVPVRGVRTRFLWVDSATKIGAFPLDRVVTVHGPSNEGKTVYVLGLGASVLDAGGVFALVDAEQTTPITWIQNIMGEHAASPNFLAMRPVTYEETVAAVRQLCNGFAAAKAAREISNDAPGLVVIDSIRKLVPKKLMDELLKMNPADEEKQKRGRFGKAPKGVDGAGGRAAQIKAALNAAWLDELIPLAAKSGVAIVLIARELNEDEDDPWARDVKVGGGRALIFDASLVMRITRAVVLNDEDRKLIGEKHLVEIRKTKIGSKDELWPRAYFHTTPAGALDPARDAIELGLDQGTLRLAGSHVKWGQATLGAGKDAAVKKLAANPVMLAELQKSLRERFVLEGAPIETPKIEGPFDGRTLTRVKRDELQEARAASEKAAAPAAVRRRKVRT